MEVQRKAKGRVVELNVQRDEAILNNEVTPALTVYADSSYDGLAIETLVS